MQNTLTITKPKIEQATKEKLEKELSFEGQVTIHIDFNAKIESSLLRLWKTTFLFSKNSAHKSKLYQFKLIMRYLII